MMRISPSVSMLGMSDQTRRLAMDMLSILAVKPGESLKVSKFGQMFPGVDADEVFPGIFIGNKSSAMNFEFLKHTRGNYVLNAAEGTKQGCVETNQDYYHPQGIQYLGLRMFDVPQTNIAKYFEEASTFIEEALNNKGVVLVHCLMGMSRSSTLVLAFLMLRRGIEVKDALRHVKKSRDIRPNDGFLRQLAELENKSNKMCK